jgi:hypothetical protein
MYRSTALNPNPNFVDTKFCTKTNKRTVPSFGQAQQMEQVRVTPSPAKKPKTTPILTSDVAPACTRVATPSRVVLHTSERASPRAPQARTALDGERAVSQACATQPTQGSPAPKTPPLASKTRKAEEDIPLGASKGAKFPRAQEATQALPSAAEPWDHLRGADRFCVFKNSARLDEECENSAIEAWGPNCATFTRARERPFQVRPIPPPDL